MVWRGSRGSAVPRRRDIACPGRTTPGNPGKGRERRGATAAHRGEGRGGEDAGQPLGYPRRGGITKTLRSRESREEAAGTRQPTPAPGKARNPHPPRATCCRAPGRGTAGTLARPALPAPPARCSARCPPRRGGTYPRAAAAPPRPGHLAGARETAAAARGAGGTGSASAPAPPPATPPATPRTWPRGPGQRR